MKSLEQLTEIINEKYIERKIALSNYNKAKLKCSELIDKLEILKVYSTLILELGKQSQTTIKEYFESIITDALQVIFGEEYSFIITIESKGDDQEPKFFLNKNGLLLEFKEDTVSGSVCDVVSYFLRIASVVLELDACPVLLMDEPFPNTKKNKLQYLCDILKKTCVLLKVQLIIISHEDSLIEAGDSIIQIGE